MGLKATTVRHSATVEPPPLSTAKSAPRPSLSGIRHQQPDPRIAQIDRLKDEVAGLQQRLARSNGTIDELTDFRTQALAQIAAQHDEITRLRASAAAASQITRLPRPGTTIGSCS